MTPIFLLLAAVVSTNPGPTRDLRFNHLTVRDGLSHSWVHAILKDRRGFMWFGTSSGLDRYDGHSFVHYAPRAGDAASLPSRSVEALIEDSRGRLWVGGIGGLSLYDRSMDRFKNFVVTDRADRQVENEVRAVLQDRKGRFWVVTSARLNEFDPETGAFRPFPNEPGDPGSRSDWPCLLEDRRGRLWIGSANGLDRYDPSTRQFVRVPSRPAQPQGLGHRQVQGLYEDAQGMLWVATLGGGLNRLNPDTLEVKLYLPEPKDPTSISESRVRRLAADGEGRLYVGTENGGLDIFDPRTETFTHNRFDNEDPSTINSNSVWAIRIDDQGIVWVGTYSGGVNYLTREGQRFRHLKARAGGLSDSHVSAVLEDHRGDLWIGTDGGGLNRMERGTGRFTRYLHDTADPRSLPSNAVWALFEDSHQVLWVGMWAGGLCRLDPEGRRFNCYRHDPADPASIAEDNVWTIREDANGELLLGMNDSGPDVFDPRTGRFSRLADLYPALRAGVAALTSPVVEPAPADGLWIGGYRGVLYLDRRTGKVTEYAHDPGDAGTISGGFLHAAHVDSRGNVWLAFEDGLTAIDAATKKIRRFASGEGLPHSTVTAILEDGSGNLWLSTLRGVSKFEAAVLLPPNPRFVNFDVQEGLQDAEFYKRSAFRSPSGQMFFGGTSGLNSFSPDDVHSNTFVPPVVLTGLELFNRPVRPGASGSPLAQAIGETRELTLSHRQSVVTFEFAALNYVAPERNRCAYKLEGFDRDWTETRAPHRASYTNLPGGRYTFRVRGANNDGVWNREGLALALRVTPPFWKTPWFVALCGAAVALGVLAGHRLRVQQLTAHEREVSRRVEEGLAADIRVLRGLLPVCAWCKRVRDDQGYWSQMEVYIRDHSQADFSHGICPSCAEKIKATLSNPERE